MRQHSLHADLPCIPRTAGSPAARFAGGSGSPLSQRQPSDGAALSDAERLTASDIRTSGTNNSDGRTTDTLHSLSGWNQGQQQHAGGMADTVRRLHPAQRSQQQATQQAGRRGSLVLSTASAKQAASPDPGMDAQVAVDPTQLAIQAAIMAQAPAMLTVLTSDGTRVLYQNAASVAYYGPLAGSGAAGSAPAAGPGDAGSWQLQADARAAARAALSVGVGAQAVAEPAPQEQPLARLFSLHDPGALEVCLGWGCVLRLRPDAGPGGHFRPGEPPSA